MAFTLSRLFGRRQSPAPATRLYEAIVAQARLPELYQRSGMPDTIEGRFEMLALHVFLMQRRLLLEGVAGAELARDLSERFVSDMEDVLRERGMGDLAVPKKVRALAGELHGRSEAYESAFRSGHDALAHAIAASVPLEGEAAERAGAVLADYANRIEAALLAQPFEELSAGVVQFRNDPTGGAPNHDG